MSDFTLDYTIDEQDADVLAAHWDQTAGVTIKEGDATNDGIANIDDANSLIGFWSDSLNQPVSASANYYPATGEVTVSMQNVSYFKLVGPDGTFNGDATDFSSLSPLKTCDNDTAVGAYTKGEWMQADLSLGNIATAGLNADELKMVINYKGSGLANGITVNFGEEFATGFSQQKNASKKAFFFDGQKILLNQASTHLTVNVYTSLGQLKATYEGTLQELNHTQLPGKGVRILQITDQHNTHYSKKYINQD
jgi:hypothetical protein